MREGNEDRRRCSEDQAGDWRIAPATRGRESWGSGHVDAKDLRRVRGGCMIHHRRLEAPKIHPIQARGLSALIRGSAREAVEPLARRCDASIACGEVPLECATPMRSECLWREIRPPVSCSFHPCTPREREAGRCTRDSALDRLIFRPLVPLPTTNACSLG